MYSENPEQDYQPIFVGVVASICIFIMSCFKDTNFILDLSITISLTCGGLVMMWAFITGLAIFFTVLSGDPHQVLTTTDGIAPGIKKLLFGFIFTSFCFGLFSAFLYQLNYKSFYIEKI